VTTTRQSKTEARVTGISPYSAVSKPITSGIGDGLGLEWSSVLGRKNYLFAGSDAGCRRVARISELLPWN
jgi:hypothetical protein